jgi:hypothetical protein
MPRIPPLAFARSVRLHPLLPPLMRVCRNVDIARRELRWLEEEVFTRSYILLQKYSQFGFTPTRNPGTELLKRLLRCLVLERAKGVPLAYVVGSSVFILDVVIQ